MKYLPRPYDSITNDYVKSELDKLRKKQEIHRTAMGYGNETPSESFAEMGGKLKYDGLGETSTIQRRPKDNSFYDEVLSVPDNEFLQGFTDQEYNPDIPDEQSLIDASHNRIMTSLNTRPVKGVMDESDYQPDRYKKNVNWTDLGILAGNSAAGITNLVSGLQKRKYPNYQRLHPEKVNYRVAADNAADEIQRGLTSVKQTLRNSNGSQGAYLAGVSNAASEAGKNAGLIKSGLLSKQEAENVAIENNARQVNTQIANAETDERFKTNADYARLRNTGIAQLGAAGANYLKDKKLDKSDAAQFAYVKKLYPYLFPGTKDLTKIG